MQWKRWWTSPQASQWDAAVHAPVLGRLLLLYVEDPESTEIRQIEHQMGLTPKGMKDLGWRVDDESKPEKAKKASTSKAKDADPRAVLRAV